MRLEQARQILREHEAELRRNGITRLRLFGSVARDEATENSDIDILADFDPSIPVRQWRVGGLQQELSALLNSEVDLSSEPWLKADLREQILREAVVAF